MCGISFQPAGTGVSPQPSGDCQKLQCDGAGNVDNVPDDTDPLPPTGCATPFCLGGTSMPGNVAHGTMCTDGGGRTCDGAGACITSFSVLRLGNTGATFSPAFIEERKLDGVLVGSTTLPTTASGANLALTLQGGSSSEGSLSLSSDGRYLIVGGYNSAIASPTVPTVGPRHRSNQRRQPGHRRHVDVPPRGDRVHR